MSKLQRTKPICKPDTAELRSRLCLMHRKRNLSVHPVFLFISIFLISTAKGGKLWYSRKWGGRLKTFIANYNEFHSVHNHELPFALCVARLHLNTSRTSSRSDLCSRPIPYIIEEVEAASARNTFQQSKMCAAYRKDLQSRQTIRIYQHDLSNKS